MPAQDTSPKVRKISYRLLQWPKPPAPFHPLRRLEHRHNRQRRTDQDQPIHQRQREGTERRLEDRQIDDEAKQGELPEHGPIQPAVRKRSLEDGMPFRAEAVGLAEPDEDE